MNKAFILKKILPIILIVGIGVQTVTSCSSDDSGDGNETPSSSSAEGTQSSSSEGTPSSSSVASSSSGGGLLNSSSSGGQPLSSSSVVGGSSSSIVGGSSSSSIENNNIIYGEDLVDSRDGKTYKTVVIGTQTWMAENLSYNASGSWCNGTEADNCNGYGRHYNWNTAMANVCPDGWHLPSDEEWSTLTNYIESEEGCSGCAGKYLKATSGWANNGNGTDSYGFAALPGGYGQGGGFGFAGYYSYWWSTNEDTTENAYSRSMIYNAESAYGYDNDKSYLFNVRCVYD